MPETTMITTTLSEPGTGYNRSRHHCAIAPSCLSRKKYGSSLYLND